MEVLCIISEKGELRQIDGTKGKIDVVDVIVKSGNDEFRASAFDDLAKEIVNGTIHEGALYRANIVFTIRSTEKGKFQSARIERMGLLYEFIPTY